MTAIVHEPDNACFSATLEGGDPEQCRAVLEYSLQGNDIDFNRTFVPPVFRGKGVAESLVRTGLRWAKEQGFTISASCWYVAKFLK